MAVRPLASAAAVLELIPPPVHAPPLNPETMDAVTAAAVELRTTIELLVMSSAPVPLVVTLANRDALASPDWSCALAPLATVIAPVGRASASPATSVPVATDVGPLSVLAAGSVSVPAPS